MQEVMPLLDITPMCANHWNFSKVGLFSIVLATSFSTSIFPKLVWDRLCDLY